MACCQSTAALALEEIGVGVSGATEGDALQTHAHRVLLNAVRRTNAGWLHCWAAHGAVPVRD